GVKLRWAFCGEPRGARLRVLADDLDGGVVVEILAEGQIGLFVDLFLFFVLVDVLQGGTGRTKPGELRLLEVGLGPTGSGEDGFDELLVKWIDRHGGCTSWSLRQARTGVGRARSRVWSRRRWRDLRFSFINWLSPRSWSIEPRAADCSASAGAGAS